MKAIFKVFPANGKRTDILTNNLFCQEISDSQLIETVGVSFYVKDSKELNHLLKKFKELGSTSDNKFSLLLENLSEEDLQEIEMRLHGTTFKNNEK